KRQLSSRSARTLSQGGNPRRAALRAVQTERSRIAKLIPHELFCSPHCRIEGLIVDAERRPGDLIRIHVVFPQTNQTTAIKNRVIWKFVKSPRLLFFEIGFIDKSFEIPTEQCECVKR